MSIQTRSYHVSNLGSFAGRVSSYADSQGYVTYHASERYARMSDAELAEMAESHRVRSIRAAAATELAERAIQAWRAAN